MGGEGIQIGGEGCLLSGSIASPAAGDYAVWSEFGCATLIRAHLPPLPRMPLTTFQKARLLAAWCLGAYLAHMYVRMGWIKFDPNGFWTAAFERRRATKMAHLT